MEKTRNNAQSLITYMLLLSLVVAALLGVRTFILRSVQEKYRQAADVYGAGEQYERVVTNELNLDPYIEPDPENPGEDLDSCPTILTRVAALQRDIDILTTRVYGDTTSTDPARLDGLIPRAAEMENQAAILEDQDLAESASRLRASALTLRAQADVFLGQIDAKQGTIGDYRTEYPECFE